MRKLQFHSHGAAKGSFAAGFLPSFALFYHGKSMCFFVYSPGVKAAKGDRLVTA